MKWLLNECLKIQYLNILFHNTHKTPHIQLGMPKAYILPFSRNLVIPGLLMNYRYLVKTW